MFFFGAALFGCKKDNQDLQKVNLDAVSSVRGNSAFLAGSAGPTLDWENISFMPTPPNTPAIAVPWQGGVGGAKIDDDILFDYHRSDGWELVYNTFNTTTVYSSSYFMLYNRYRGLLRTYFYITPGGNYPSDNITHFLAARGANAASSPILNFAGQEVINVNANSLTAAQLQPYKVSSTGSWYAAEFELAYDPNTSITPYDQLRLEWQINPNSLTNISLNGIETGDISGTLQTPSTGPNFLSGISNGIVDGGIKVGSTSAANAIKFVTSVIKTPIINASTNAAGGIIKGFLSGILGGNISSTSTQKISLKINSKITITGTSSTGSQLFDNIFSLPGTQNVINTIPFYPSYGNPLGVFNVSAKPIVSGTLTSSPVEGETHRVLVRQAYTVNENSFQLVFNPVVTEAANITNIKKEVVMMNVPTTISGLTFIDGIPEQIAERLVYTGVTTAIERTASREMTVPVGLAVRVSFDVVPKDGAPKSTIVKTFLATETMN